MSTPPPPKIAVLFARHDSIYKTLPGVDVFDIDRDARRYRGDQPVIAHPPCRAWGILRHMAQPRIDEKALALWSVLHVRMWGGVLEHPAGSTLWPVAKLPEPGERDAWGGFTIAVPQFWWGHRANKATRLYICGCEPRDLPEVPLVLGEPTHVVNTGHGVRKGHPSFRPHCTKNERERTPPGFANWLVDLARRCRPPHQLIR